MRRSKTRGDQSLGLAYLLVVRRRACGLRGAGDSLRVLGRRPAARSGEVAGASWPGPATDRYVAGDGSSGRARRAVAPVAKSLGQIWCGVGTAVHGHEFGRDCCGRRVRRVRLRAGGGCAGRPAGRGRGGTRGARGAIKGQDRSAPRTALGRIEGGTERRRQRQAIRRATRGVGDRARTIRAFS